MTSRPGMFSLLQKLFRGISSFQFAACRLHFPLFPFVFRRSSRSPQCLCVGASSSWRRRLYLAVAIHFHSASFQLAMDEWGIFIPQLFSHFRSFLPLFPPPFQQTFNLLCAASFVTDTSGSRPSAEREARRRQDASFRRHRLSPPHS